MIPIKGQEFIDCGSVSEEELKTQILGASRIEHGISQNVCIPGTPGIYAPRIFGLVLRVMKIASPTSTY